MFNQYPNFVQIFWIRILLPTSAKIVCKFIVIWWSYARKKRVLFIETPGRLPMLWSSACGWHRSRSTMSSSGCKKSIAMPAKTWTSFLSETRATWLQRRLSTTPQLRLACHCHNSGLKFLFFLGKIWFTLDKITNTVGFCLSSLPDNQIFPELI